MALTSVQLIISIKASIFCLKSKSGDVMVLIAL